MSRNKVHLVRRLVKLEYMDGQNMVEHLNTFKERMMLEQVCANIFENRGMSKNRDKGGHGKSQGRSKSHNRLSCYYYGKSGHEKS
ncbi:hypothetical protein CR513_59361, partial [Mucuna pruriens]